MDSQREDSRLAYWEKVYYESPIQIIAGIKEGARQLVPVSSALQGLYFVALANSDIKHLLSGSWLLVPFILPVFAWLCCLVLAVSLFVPESRLTAARPLPRDIELIFIEIAKTKLRRLRWAQWILVSSVTLLCIDFLIYFFL